MLRRNHDVPGLYGRWAEAGAMRKPFSKVKDGNKDACPGCYEVGIELGQVMVCMLYILGIGRKGSGDE